MTAAPRAGPGGIGESLSDGDVAFYDNYTRTMPGGSYRITVQHSVTGVETGAFPTVSQEFAVRVPRFSLDASFVHAVQPDPGATGPFDQMLPQVTLSRPVLPWEQQLSSGVTQDKKRSPWLAVLLFAEDELPDDRAALGDSVTRTVSEVLSLDDERILVPRISTDTVAPEVLTCSCRTIDVPSDLFAAVVPRENELPYLAHVREASAAPQARADMLDAGRYGVVIGTRLPRTPGVYAAHLVSLEGFHDYLTGVPPTRELVRIVSLWSWSFTTSTTPNLHFRTVLDRVAGPAEGRTKLMLSLPDSSPGSGGTEDKEVRTRLLQGYVPVSYRTHSGERTFAWYRGPYTPVPPAELPPAESSGSTAPHHFSASQATIYLSDYGVFDIGYAAAWSLGCLLALATADLTTALTETWLHLRRLRTRMTARLTAEGPNLLTTGQDKTAWRQAFAGTTARERFHRLFTHGLPASASTALRGPARPDLSAPPPPSAMTPAPLSRVLEVLERADVRDALTDAIAEHAEVLADRLAPFVHLEPVPFEYLVPDARMLPPESLRFYYVNEAWIDMLLDGVLSTGAATSVDSALVPRLRSAVTTALRERGTWPPVAGLLLRSRLVSGWPDVAIEARARGVDAGIVRRAVIGPDTLLCLFRTAPDEVTIREAHQELHVGTDGDYIALRCLKAAGQNEIGSPLGKNIPSEPTETLDVFLRAVTDGRAREVFNLATPADSTSRPLVPEMGDILFKAGQIDAPHLLAGGGLAIQLVNAPTRVTFHWPERPAGPTTQR